MKTILFDDVKRTNPTGKREYVEITFNDKQTTCRINDHRPKSCNIVSTKTMGRTQVITWCTKLWDTKVYFRQTKLV